MKCKKCIGLIFISLLFSHDLSAITVNSTKQQNRNISKDEDLLATIKNYTFVSVTQYEDFNHMHKKMTISTEVKDEPGLYLINGFFLLNVEHKSYKIDLTLNHNLMTRFFGVTTYSESGKLEINQPSQQDIKHCYYHGFVRGIHESKVIASTCRGLRGTIFLPPKMFMIESLSNGTYILYQLDAEHLKQSKMMCSTNNVLVWKHSKFFSKNISRRPKLMKQVKQTDKKQRYVELALIAIKSVCDSYMGNRENIQDYLKQLVNFVDGYYQEMNIHVVLIHIEMWLNKDFFAIVSNGIESLSNFGNYRDRQIQLNPDSFWSKADALHIIHNQRFNAVGVASTQSMCSMYAYGINLYQENPAYTAITLTHELGHNFGLSHVNVDGKRVCACPLDECVMNPASRFIATAWSMCSIGNITKNIEMGLFECLFNIPEPSTLILGAGCGNTIIEAGEQCDCGFKENCKSKCCNSETCQLLPNAACDVGFCCENCQLRAANSQCRESANECDIPEVCSGFSPYCPKDVFKEDGTSCLDGKAYCTEGVCLTREAVCKATFGPTSSSPSLCYGWNTLGDYTGNCGLNSKSNSGYKACENADKFCGKLLCLGGRIVNPGYYVTFPNHCQTIIQQSGDPPRDIGLVPNGTICGLGKACQDKQCKSISASKCNPPCRVNSICDNLGSCRCADGRLCGKSINLLEGMIIVGSNMVVVFIIVFSSYMFVKIRQTITSKAENYYKRFTPEKL